MMRIAIYEPESFAGGMLTWGLHIQTGLRRLGHEADLITFTKSGRPKIAWSRTDGSAGLKARPSAYTNVYRLADAEEVWLQYDGIIQNDPISYLQDAAALRGKGYLEKDVPDYITVLRKARVPITTTVHCGDYSTKNFPYRALFQALPTLTGTVVTHSQVTFDAGRDLWPMWKAITVPLPYESRTPIDAPGPNQTDQRRIGITGRYTAVKGHRALAAAAADGYLFDDHNSPLDVELWGFGDVTRGPSATTMTYENLIKRGLTGVREEGRAALCMRWRVEYDRGTVTYRGGYMDALPILQTLDVHVNLTTTVASGGAIEYSQLEAMDVGCAQVSPAHRWLDEYAGEVIDSVKRWPSDRAFYENRDEHDRMLDMIGTAVAELYHRSPSEVIEQREHNRALVRTNHDPAMVASAFIDALFN